MVEKHKAKKGNEEGHKNGNQVLQHFLVPGQKHTRTHTWVSVSVYLHKYECHTKFAALKERWSHLSKRASSVSLSYKMLIHFPG